MSTVCLNVGTPRSTNAWDRTRTRLPRACWSGYMQTHLGQAVWRCGSLKKFYTLLRPSSDNVRMSFFFMVSPNQLSHCLEQGSSIAEKFRPAFRGDSSLQRSPIPGDGFANIHRPIIRWFSTRLVNSLSFLPASPSRSAHSREIVAG
jgi:hypothetical protein